MTMTAADTRRFLAEEIRVSANIRSPHLIEAIATTPRERFLPPGPWLIRGVGDMAGPRQTDDADPRHVHHDVAVAIDPSRDLYNGQPSLIARWIDELGIAPGQHVVHIGCGTGYFTALLAHVVGPSGRIDAIDVERFRRDRHAQGQRLAAKAHGMVAIYSLKEVRDDAAAGVVLGKALMSGVLTKVGRLRRDAHDVADTCVLHSTTSCLSTSVS